LDLSGFVMTGNDVELLTPMRGCLRGLTLLPAAISAGGVLVVVFFLYATVLKPSGSDSADYYLLKCKLNSPGAN
jgi:hypothetical protein